MPQSKFSSSGNAILNFCLESFHEDMGNLGKTLKPFAKTFFSKENQKLHILSMLYMT
jgi:hypothetical protein